MFGMDRYIFYIQNATTHIELSLQSFPDPYGISDFTLFCRSHCQLFDN